ncbi:MAG: SDR family NAD(P)-dependent oxidoreductase, partial [Gammaproteobacteria bacterium]|nr:SDR family NAD(P)-dependent oxidoreductase [Gammaproteobacteria bacterium]
MSYHKPHMPIISNVTGERAGEEMADAAYWLEHVLAPVRFANGMEALSQEEVTAFVEVGPQPVLLGMGRQCLPEHEGLWLPSLRRGQDDWQQMLQTLGQLYTQGVDVDWAGFERDYSHDKVTLPSYPFQRQRYWVETSHGLMQRTALSEDGNWHPLLGTRLDLPLSQEIRYESRLATHSPRHQDHHRLFGINVVAAASYVSLLVQAMWEARDTHQCHLTDMMFEQALILPDGESRRIQLVMDSGDEVKAPFKVVSLPTTEEHQERSWMEHVSGQVHWQPSQNEANSITTIKSEEIQGRSLRKLAGEDIYSTLNEEGYTLGEAYRWIGKVWQGKNEALGLLQMPELPDRVEDYELYPGLVDSCFQILGLVQTFGGLESTGSDDAIFVPFHIDAFNYFQPLGRGDLWCYAQHETPDKEDGRVMRGNIQVWTMRGELVVEVRGLELRKIPRQALMRALQAEKMDQVTPLLYDVVWQAAPAPETSRGDQDEISEGRWLVVSDQGDWLKNVAVELASAGQRYELVQLNGNSENPLNVSDPADVEEWLALLAKIEGWDNDTLPDEEALSGVIWQVGVDEHAQGVARLRPGCGGALAFVQALLRSGDTQLTQGLWLMTRGGVAVEEGSEVDPEASAIWGLGRTVMEEQPPLHCRLLDLSAHVPPVDELVNYMLAAGAGDEGQHAFHEGQWYVPRLARVDSDLHVGREKMVIEAKASYVITGGLGALGLHAARWLLAQGAQRIVLNSRRLPDESTQLMLEELEAKGASIEVVAGDVADKRDVERLMAVANADAERPLRGVIHAAGVLDDGVLTEQSWERFETVLKPKVLGAHYLHEATREMTLDFFVLYSSVASLLGSPSQSNYATANTYLDAFAQQRRSYGLPALSLAWGPWAGPGLAGRTRGLDARLARVGMQKLKPQQGVAVMERLLNSAVSQAAVLAVDWSRYAQTETMQRYLSRLTPRTMEDAGEKSALVQQLEETQKERREGVLVAYLQEELRDVLGLQQTVDPQQGFFDLGMDSLMAVEVGRRLQQQLGLAQALSSTMLFDYPTIEALAKQLLERLQLLDKQPAPKRQPRLLEITEPIAIVGLACRFPGGQDANDFWQMLENGVDAISEVPSERWDIDAYYDP